MYFPTSPAQVGIPSPVNYIGNSPISTPSASPTNSPTRSPNSPGSPGSPGKEEKEKEGKDEIIIGEEEEKDRGDKIRREE